MVQCRGSYEKVEVADGLALGAQPATLAAENSRSVFIHADYLDTAEEILESLLTLAWVPGIEDALIQIGQ